MLTMLAILARVVFAPPSSAPADDPLQEQIERKVARIAELMVPAGGPPPSDAERIAAMDGLVCRWAARHA
jgi:hypothetical protein